MFELVDRLGITCSPIGHAGSLFFYRCSEVFSNLNNCHPCRLCQAKTWFSGGLAR